MLTQLNYATNCHHTPHEAHRTDPSIPATFWAALREALAASHQYQNLRSRRVSHDSAIRAALGTGEAAVLRRPGLSSLRRAFGLAPERRRRRRSSPCTQSPKRRAQPDARAFLPAFDFNRSSWRASSAASASSHSLKAMIFGSFAVVLAQTIQ